MPVITRRRAHVRWSVSAIFIFVLVSLTVIRLFISGMLELHFDEAYYWHWANNPQLSYYDHPPMVAWLIMLGTSIGGDTEFGVRLMGQICVAITSWLMFDAAYRAFGPRAALFSGIAIQATLLVGAGSIIMTPDTPLLLFTTVMLWALLRVCKDESPLWWILAGAASGAALLSKYTAFLSIFAVGLWLINTPRRRSWFATPWPWTGLALCLLLFAPVVIWNFQNDWVSFIKQGGRLAMATAIRPELILEYAGGQLGVMTPILCGLLVFGVFKLFDSDQYEREPVQVLLVTAFLVPAIFFLLVSPIVRVQANWPAFMWPAAVLATSEIISDHQVWQTKRSLVYWSVATGSAMVLLVWLHALMPHGLCVASDPVAQLHGQREMTLKVAQIARSHRVKQIISPSYATASFMRFYMPKDISVIHVAKEPRYIGFDNVRWDHTQPVIAVYNRPRIPLRIARFLSSKITPIEIWRNYKGCAYSRYFVLISS